MSKNIYRTLPGSSICRAADQVRQATLLFARQAIPFATGLLVFAALAACSTIYPIPPRQSNAELIKEGQTDAPPPPTLESARSLLNGLRNVLERAASNRHTANLVANEFLYYGTLLSVLGVSLDSRAARNVGAGTGAIASLFTGHYKVADQETVFRKALARVDCAQDALHPITPIALSMFDSSELTEAQLEAVSAIPRNTAEYVRTVQTDLYVSLNNFALSAPSRDDLEAAVKRFNEARELAAKTPAPKQPSPQTSKQIQAIKDRLMDRHIDPNSLDIRVVESVDPSGVRGARFKLLDLQLDSMQMKEAEKYAALLTTEFEEKVEKTAFRDAATKYAAALSICLKQYQQ